MEASSGSKFSSDQFGRLRFSNSPASATRFAYDRHPSSPSSSGNSVRKSDKAADTICVMMLPPRGFWRTYGTCSPRNRSGAKYTLNRKPALYSRHSKPPKMDILTFNEVEQTLNAGLQPKVGQTASLDPLSRLSSRPSQSTFTTVTLGTNAMDYVFAQTIIGVNSGCAPRSSGIQATRCGLALAIWSFL